MAGKRGHAHRRQGEDPPALVFANPSVPHWSSSRWVVLLLIGVFVLFLALWFLGLRAMANADHLGILDDPVVTDAATTSCATLQADVATVRVPASASTTTRIAGIRAEDAAITRLVATMRALGTERLAGDEPAVSWLEDWATLARLREKYADDLAAGGTPALTIPTVDGIAISQRMADVATCPVVAELTRVG